MSKTNKHVFTDIYHQNHWGSEESHSGPGSTLAATATALAGLAQIVDCYGITSILDVGCGDHNWLNPLPSRELSYVGVDVVADMIADNQRRFGSSFRRFIRGDITRDDLPVSDLAIARDCLVHLPHDEAMRVVANIKRSGCKWLLVTTFPDHPENRDIQAGEWRPMNLEAAPFSFPPPAAMINEDCQECCPSFQDKTLALWRVSDLLPAPTTGVRSVVVSVDYDDFLSVTLPRNAPHFASTLVVTSKRDKATQAVALANGCDVYTTEAFYQLGAMFNKGLAIEEAFDVVGREGWLCVWDADIILPSEVDWQGLDPDCLSVPARRVLTDPSAFRDDMNWSDLHSPTTPQEHDGYCQIFNASSLSSRPWYGVTWKHAGGGDSDFSARFAGPERRRPCFEVLHLGDEGEDRIGDNWLGRCTPKIGASVQSRNTDAISAFRKDRKSNGTDGERISPVICPPHATPPAPATKGLAKTMRFYWDGPMSFMRYATLLSFRAWHPDWAIELYSPKSCPRTEQSWNTGEVDDRLYAGRDYRGSVESLGVKTVDVDVRPGLSPAQNSDLFQWQTLGSTSGFYSDMDILWTGSLEPMRQQYKQHDAIFCNEQGFVAVGFFASHFCPVFSGIHAEAAKHPPGAYQTYGSDAVYRHAGTRNSQGRVQGGSQTLRALARNYPKSRIAEVPMQTVYPFDWRQIGSIFHDTKPLPNVTVGLHWFGGSPVSQEWNGMLTEENWFKHVNTFTKAMRQFA